MSIGGGCKIDVTVYSDSEEVTQPIKIIIGTTEPATPQINDLWIDVS